MKIGHIADIHIRNFRYHDQYKKIFKNLFESIKQEQVEVIVVAGDIAHTKTQLSPEYFKLATSFFNGLRSSTFVKKIIIIPGNHDGNLKNLDREDAIAPVIDAINYNNSPFIFLRNSEKYSYKNIDFYHLSIFDRINQQLEPDDDSRINIALYHGAIKGAKTDLGWEVEHGDNESDLFKNFDYGMLGDIHKSNQSIDILEKFRYPGSLVQQNFGEHQTKGYLVWDIYSKYNFDCKFIEIDNPNPFVEVIYNPLEDYKFKKGSKVKIHFQDSYLLSEVSTITKAMQKTFELESISYYILPLSDSVKADYFLKESDNLNDVYYQNKLIESFHKDLDKDKLEKIFIFNKELNSNLAKQDKNFGTVWKLNIIEWNNFFKYGKNNKINFEKLNGIVGIFGKNYSGKSSIIDIILFGLFGSISKETRKNIDLINSNEKQASLSIIFTIGKTEYCVERDIEKIGSGRTSINYSSRSNKLLPWIDINNEYSKIEIQKQIIKNVGSLDDFKNTAFSSQFGFLEFVNLKSSGRKEIFSRFLGLEIFQDLFQETQEIFQEIKTKIKIYESDGLTDNLDLLEGTLDGFSLILEKEQKKLNLLVEEDIKIKNNIERIKIDLSNIKINVSNENKEELIKELKKQKEINIIENISLDKIKKEYDDMAFSLNKIKNLLNKIDINNIKENERLNKENRQNLLLLKKDKEYSDKHINILKNDIKNISPCDESYEKCQFSCNKNKLKEKLKESIEKNNEILKEIENIKIDDSFKDLIEKYNSFCDKSNELQTNIHKLKSEILLKESKISKIEDKINELSLIIEDIKKQEILYKKNILLKDELLECIDKSKNIQSDIKCINDKILDLRKQIIILEEKRKIIEDRNDKLNKLYNDFEILKLFRDAVHKNGIPTIIIKNKVAALEKEINIILSMVAPFKIILQLTNNKIDILLINNIGSERPIELASGAEQTITALAIKLALYEVALIPKSDIFILDEPGHSLDENSMKNFTKMLDYIRTKFRAVLLITHLDSLKDHVDSIIDIQEKDEFAYIYV